MIATVSAVGSVSASRSVRSGRFYCNAIDRMVEKMGPTAMEEKNKLKDLPASQETLAKVGLLSAPRQPNG